ncbi:head decoration protein [Desulfurobacterium sp.]
MTVSANIGTYTPPKPEEAVYSEERHPAVILSMSVKAAQEILERGTIVGKDSDGLIVPYNPSATVTLDDGSVVPAPEATPIGVLVERIDTDKETIGNVLVHGVVFRERLIVVGGTVTEDDLNKLASIGIWNIG